MPPVRYAQSGDTSIAYQVFGDGPHDVVLTPGFVSHLDLQWTIPSFTGFAEALGSFARVIIFDKRGTGLSDPTVGAVRFDTRIDDIRAIMDANGVQSATLVGISEGGPMSVMFAATHPERVSSLVLYGTFTSGRVVEPEMWRRFEAAVDEWGSGLTATIFSTARTESSVRRRLAGLFERASASPGMARALMESIRDLDVTPVLQTIHAPTLVLHRRDDPFAPASWGRVLANAIPDARFVDVDGNDHLPWFGDYRELVNQIGEFTVGHPPPRRPERRLATVLFTDIVDSTAIASDLGDLAWSDLLEQHNLLVRDLLAEFDGQEMRHTGDGILALFDTPTRAIDFAHVASTEVRALGLDIRAGIHTGEIEVLGDQAIGGVAVHLGARVMNLAGAAEILVSGTVHDLMMGSSFRFIDRGSHPMKGVPGMWKVYAVGETATDVEIDLREEKSLTTGDRMSLYLARTVPGALRSLASLANTETEVGAG